MELRDLQALQAVIEERSFRAAGERLHRSASSITAHIKALEQDIGSPLVLRSENGAMATPAGQALIDATRGVLITVDQAARAARLAAAGDTRRLRIGHNGVAGLDVLHRVLPPLTETDPPLQVRLIEAPNSDLLAQLVAGTLDLAIARPPIDDESLTHQLLFEEQLVIVVPADHRLARRNRASLNDLRTDPFVLPPREQTPRVHDLVLDLLHEHGDFRPAIVQEASSIASLLILVASRAGVTLLPRRWPAFYRSSGTKSLRLAHPPLTLPVHLAWRKHDQNPAVATARNAIITTHRSAARPRRASPLKG